MAKTKRQGRGKFELMESGRGGSVYYIKSKDSYEVHDKTDDTVKRSYYKNINQANHVAEKLNQIRQTYGKQMPRLTPSERRAIELYRNHRKKSDIMGVTIPDIDRLIVDALENSSLINDSPLFSDVAEQYALNQLRKGVTHEHSVTTKNRIIKINESFSDVMIGSLSTGVSNQSGFLGKRVIFKILVRKNHHGLYVEPFAKYGSGSGRNWDGVKKQTSFSSEQEFVIQKGSLLKMVKFETNDRLNESKQLIIWCELIQG